MARQKPEKQKRESEDYNFHVIDRKDQRENLIKVSFIIPRNNVKKAAVSLYRDLICHCSKAYFTQRAINIRLASLYGASLSLDFESFDRDFILSFSIVAPDDSYIKTFKNLKSEISDFLINLIEKGCFRDEKIFETLKKNALDLTTNAMKDISNIAALKFTQNFLPKTSYKELEFGLSEELESLTFLDIVQVEEEIKNSDRIVIFLGNPEARTALKLKNHFNPTPFIAPLRVNPIEISKPADLRMTSTLNNNSLLFMGYRFPSVHSENDYVVTKVVEILLDTNSIFLDSLHSIDISCKISMFNGFGAISIPITSSSYEVVLSFVKKTFQSEFKNTTEEDLALAKRAFKHMLLDYASLINEQANFIIETTLLSISNDVNIYLERLESLTLAQVFKFYESGSYIGSICVDGKRK